MGFKESMSEFACSASNSSVLLITKHLRCFLYVMAGHYVQNIYILKLYTKMSFPLTFPADTVHIDLCVKIIYTLEF